MMIMLCIICTQPFRSTGTLAASDDVMLFHGQLYYDLDLPGQHRPSVEAKVGPRCFINDVMCLSVSFCFLLCLLTSRLRFLLFISARVGLCRAWRVPVAISGPRGNRPLFQEPSQFFRRVQPSAHTHRPTKTDDSTGLARFRIFSAYFFFFFCYLLLRVHLTARYNWQCTANTPPRPYRQSQGHRFAPSLFCTRPLRGISIR